MWVVFRDCGWRTWLGTCFYDRVTEVDEVVKGVAGRWVVLVLGPRNVGKSELIRYVLARRLNVKFVYFDARLARLERSLRHAVEVARGIDKRFVLEALVKVFDHKLGLVNVSDLINIVLEVFRRVEASPYLVIDEFNYIGDVPTLEALAKAVSFYPMYSNLHLVISSSEGEIMDYLTLGKLSGYRTRVVFVDEMPPDDFSKLYEEYCGRNPCRLGLEEYLEYVGRLPGYLKEVAELDRRELSQWIERHKVVLQEALHSIADTLKTDFKLVLEAARKLICEDGKPETPQEHRIARELTKANIVYPIGFTGRYKPQLKVYAKLICGSTELLR